MLIKNAKIYTMSPLGIIENGFVLLKDGKISEVGEGEKYPIHATEEVIDAGGMLLFPGFIDAHCHLGLFEDALGFEGADGNEESDPCTPHLRALDGMNPLDKCFGEAVEAGVTTAVVAPGSANAIGGQITAVKTYGRVLDKMVLQQQPIAIKFALGENPKTVYNSKEQSPVTRMATAGIIREMLAKANRYRLDVLEAEDDDELEMPDYDAKCEALIPLLNGKIPAHFHAHRCDDIFTAVRIAKEFGLKFTIIHGTQGHLLAEDLAEEKVCILSGPLLCDRSKPEMADLTPKAPAILQKAGIKLAIITDHPVIPIQYLTVCAGLAVREGMEPLEALKAITIYPAEICGIDDRVGSIAVGKDADLVLYASDPLLLSAKPELVIGGGKIRFTKTKGSEESPC